MGGASLTGRRADYRALVATPSFSMGSSMWKKMLALIAIGSAFAGSPARARLSDPYAQGVADWRTLQEWFATQTGDRAKGANYWAANRNVPGHRTCTAAAPRSDASDKAAFIAGCHAAKSRLDPIDDRRRSYPEYRAGFTDEAERLPLVTGVTPASTQTQRSAVAPSPPPAVASERERAAEELRRQLQKQAGYEQMKQKLKELGFQLLSPVDLNLDWKSFTASDTKVAIRGTYVQAHDVEMLSTPDNRDLPRIRLYTNDASREARKLMLECRNSDFRYSACEMVVGATIRTCVRNKGELNEKQVPCLDVQEAYLVP